MLTGAIYWIALKNQAYKININGMRVTKIPFWIRNWQILPEILNSVSSFNSRRDEIFAGNILSEWYLAVEIHIISRKAICIIFWSMWNKRMFANMYNDNISNLKFKKLKENDSMCWNNTLRLKSIIFLMLI